MRPIGSMVKRQRDFSAGQIDKDALRRDDRPEFAYGIRYGKNCVSGNSGSLKRRVSRRFLYKSNSTAWRDEYRPFAGYSFQVAFSAGLFEARQNGVIVASIPAPWTAAMVAGLTWVFAGENIFIAGPAPLAPVVVNFSQIGRAHV